MPLVKISAEVLCFQLTPLNYLLLHPIGQAISGAPTQAPQLNQRSSKSKFGDPLDWVGM
jgi:hypothetical protein